MTSSGSGSSTITPPVQFSIPQHYLFPQLLVVRWAIRTDGWTDRQTATPAGCLLLADGVYAIYAIAVVASFGVPLSSHPNDLHYISTKPSLFANKQPQTDGKTPAIIHNKQNNNTRTYCYFLLLFRSFCFCKFVLYCFCFRAIIVVVVVGFLNLFPINLSSRRQL